MFHDDMAHRRQLQAKAKRDKTAAAYRQLTSLDPEKVKAMRAQEMLKAQMKFSYSTQDKKSFEKIQKKLDTKEQTFFGKRR